MKNLDNKKILAIHRLPGTGQSTFALKYAYYFTEIDKNHITLWINAENEDKIFGFFSKYYQFSIEY